MTEFHLKQKVIKMMKKQKPTSVKKVSKYEEQFNKMTELAMIQKFYQMNKNFKAESESLDLI